MSGGHFNYAYCQTSQFADELRNDLDEQGKDLGDGWPRPTYGAEVSGMLTTIAAIAEYTSLLMKEAEWLCSGDTGEDTFVERVSEIEKNRNALIFQKKPQSQGSKS